MDKTKQILISVPEEWERHQKGKFFEDFVSEILRPLRFKVTKRIRFTGMEIDLLAKSEDQPRTILVECKAYRDPIQADVISKLIGNVTIRMVDEGWLFTTSDLSKDGKGQLEEINNNLDLRKKFTWYSPEKIIQILINNNSIIDPITLEHFLSKYEIGVWTLVISHLGYFWLVEFIQSGIPSQYTIFDAKTGKPYTNINKIKQNLNLSSFNSLKFVQIDENYKTILKNKVEKITVAQVISGDSWDDPRPSRPTDFVGRDELIQQIQAFHESIRCLNSTTRIFAITSPSGWGKSSLILKLIRLSKRKIDRNISITAVDTRSAINTTFVFESIRLAFLQAQKERLLKSKCNFKVTSSINPLDSPDFINAIENLKKTSKLIVLIFDQFEELFFKEELFEIFSAIRVLSLDIDARQVPIVLGFAWKIDISLPQQHPAYYLWHQIEDRRKTFGLREFGKKDILKIVSKAQNIFGNRLTLPLRNRLIEQCQGFPWLLKKLLVHVLKKLSTTESQYLLLERELDIEELFKNDLSSISEEEIRCLKFVASKGPISVAEVEENFKNIITNNLLNIHLLVRSGMNYVVYWDIFRDYLLEQKVPFIPWMRTFQRGPSVVLKTLNTLLQIQPASATDLASALNLNENPCLNILGDLVALQLVDMDINGSYKVANYISSLDPFTIAKFVQGQLKKHVVVKEIDLKWEKGKPESLENWSILFSNVYSRTSPFSKATISVYANNLKNWLLFAGILEQVRNSLVRAIGNGNLMGIVKSAKLKPGTFVGSSTPNKIEGLLKRLLLKKDGIERSVLEKEGFRNALADSIALDLIYKKNHNLICLNDTLSRIDSEDFNKIIDFVKIQVLNKDTTKIIDVANSKGMNCEKMGHYLKEQLGANWKQNSSLRYARGIKTFLLWAKIK